MASQQNFTEATVIPESRTQPDGGERRISESGATLLRGSPQPEPLLVEAQCLEGARIDAVEGGRAQPTEPSADFVADRLSLRSQVRDSHPAALPVANFKRR